MASRINTTEYMYCSSRIRAMENSLISADKLRILADTSTFEEAINKLSEMGITPVYTEDGEVDTEQTLQKVYTDACKLIYDCVPHAENLDFLRYPYDCNNLKAAIKCNIRGISPVDMMYDCGTRTIQEACDAVDGEASVFPTNMSTAIVQAQQTYAKTKNPQNIDMILDRACYSDMLECAYSSGCEFFVKLVKTKIDLTNIIICIRLIRMKMGRAGHALLMGALLDGGTYDQKFYTEGYEDGESRLCEMLAFSEYGKFVSLICESSGDISAVEKFSDDMYMDIAKRAKGVAFGPEVAAGFLIAHEYQLKNLRIILDAKKSKKTAQTISERLRCSYV